jgi:hypothetical protein
MALINAGAERSQGACPICRPQKNEEVGMRFEPSRWCAKCHLRIAPYEVKTVYRKMAYHQQCFLMVVREEAERAKEHRREAGLAKTTRGAAA